MKALLPLAAILLAPWAAMAQSSLSYQVITSGTERFCAADQFLVSPLTPDSFVVRADARVTLWSQSGITLLPGFKASGWNPGAGFRAIVAPQNCYTYIWKGTVSDAWADAHNWQPLGVPGAQDVAVIQAAPHAPIYIGVGEGVRKLVMDWEGLPAGAGLTLRAPLTVGDTLLLTSGIIYTPVDTAMLLLPDDALALGASDSSYVEGRVLKAGNDAFVFPVGRNGKYRPIGMSAPGSSGAEFRGEYFEGNSDWTWSHANKQSGLADISRNEYWKLDRLASASDVSVTLTWDSLTSCAFDTLANLRVTAYDTTGSGEWKDLGNGGTTGDTLVGTVVTDGVSAKYGAYAIASIEGFSCSSKVSSKPTEAILDASGNSMYLKRSLIVSFHPVQIKREAVDNLGIVSTDLNVFLKQAALDTLAATLPSSLDRYRLIRIFKQLTTNDTLALSRLGDTLRVPKFWSVFELVIPETDTVTGIMSKLREKMPIVHYAHLNYAMHPTCEDWDESAGESDDEAFSTQISLDPEGAYHPTEHPRIGINARKAWEHEVGREYVRVGVFDDGLIKTHPDFQFNGVSVVKDGWDFQPPQGSLYPVPFSEFGNHSHGTACGGIIGAVRDNGTGIAGIAGGSQIDTQHGVSLYGLKVLTNAEGNQNISPSLSELADAVEFSALQFPASNANYAYGIHVGNHSYRVAIDEDLEIVNATAYQLLKDVFHDVSRQQVISVAGRGNNGNEEPYPPMYPACFHDNWVISVGGTGTDGAYATLGNGADNQWQPNIGKGIDVAAPSITSTIRTLRADYAGGALYSAMGRTSAAAAHVSGVAALLLSKHNHPTPHPDNLSPEDVEWLLEKTATDAMLSEETQESPYLTPELIAAINTPGYDDYIGWGRVDAGAAMALLVGPEFDLRHYVNPSGLDQTVEQTNVSVSITESSTLYEDNWGNPFAAGNYVADVYRVYIPFTAPLSGTKVIYDLNAEHHPGYWPRHSASNLFGPLEEVGDDMVINLREEVNISLLTPPRVTGYTYKMYDPETDEFLGWLPVNPAQARLAYSVLVQDLQHVECGDGRSGEQVITQNTMWDTDMFPCGDVTVTTGNHLTVKGRVYFVPDAKLTVEKGARLTVDGGTLTIPCPDANWQGVEVYGTPLVPPSTTLGGPHGFVHLINGATIEHAKAGVTSVQGGIVRSNGSGSEANRITFRNCRKGIVLKPYIHAQPLLTGSSILRTDFICDAPMNHPSYVSNGQRVGVNEFVSAWLHPRTRIIDCTFTNTIDYTEGGSPGSFPPHVRGLGIIGIDTRFEVSNCDFTGMFRAVNVMHTINSTMALTLKYSTFTNNMQGLLSEGSFADLVEDNDFFVPSREGTPIVDSWGAFMLRGQQYTVQKNLFTRTGPGTTHHRGFVSRGSSDFRVPTGGLLFDNDFTNTFIGTQVEQHNLHLQMRCNDYTGVDADWVINWQSEGSSLGPQGTGCLPGQYRAGNKFLDGGSNIWSRAVPFYYAYTAMETEEQPIISSFSLAVNDESCNDAPTSPTCPSASPCSGNPAPCIVAYDGEIAAREAERTALLAALDSNGTKTSTLLAHIADSTYSNSTLTSELLQWSLLSDTVLKAACQRHPFFHENQILSIALNNSPVTREAWPYVVGTFNHMKEQYADSIIAAQNTDTLRTIRVIEREKEFAETNRYRVVTEHLQSFLDKDSIPDSTYMMIHYLTDSIVGRQWKQLAVGTALSLDSVSWARTLLDNIPLENEEDTAFYDLHNMAIALREDTLTWLDMNLTQRALIEGLADGETMMKGYAEAILSMLDDTILVRIPEEFVLPSERLGEEDVPPAPTIVERTEHIKVYPNPFSNIFNVHFELANEAKEVRFEVFDLTGRRLLSETASGVQTGTRILNLGPCKGLYLLRITADGRTVNTEKLVCVEQ